MEPAKHYPKANVELQKLIVSIGLCGRYAINHSSDWSRPLVARVILVLDPTLKSEIPRHLNGARQALLQQKHQKLFDEKLFKPQNAVEIFVRNFTKQKRNKQVTI